MIAAIALGSNLSSTFGGREATLHIAVERLGAVGKVTAVSAFYDTEPVGYTDQPRFLNGAVLLETDLSPAELMRTLLGIELGMGRQREGVPAKGPRVIDLDLLFVGDLVVQSAELTLPHPAMHERAFVLEPLAGIAPHWKHPILGLTVVEMLSRLENS
ncbi:2-amino-4-hydroxy-6-hydroxymethyldihydropteridine diphosphokinase [Granulicella tundricola]|uniref:2-amino-4-hydroxy-6-hydroxymethyldihydropteridine pyrophosphokinase n=1 Tax=Granulicella tundricola (strain ATCC BAA-1859 / DSM 23138 / MP5ACTX9) TaxID=1198114 RepID=E8WVV7_GRATM|nr:2-amino-4-hydroxy-6-hydroxymethyldihydropteridine diphosphokinase [Granulicella tundricola]ADW70716.1 2-amino-4-hydroxy-6-hydroxymethyldihydropteridine pyrophosphokinase [Granulicella tundricola MP5ACTX9]